MSGYEQKEIIFSSHAKTKMDDRGASEDEVRKAIEEGSSEPARKGRLMFRKNLPFNAIELFKNERFNSSASKAYYWPEVEVEALSFRL